MWIATATLPVELASDLAEGRFAALTELAGDGAAVSFARGIALSNLGRMRRGARGA